jgi:orotate phosphoribosyltransferase
MVENILELSSEKGHFLLESGYHAGLWMDLESLFLRPAALEPMLEQLATRIGQYEPALICGPLVEGAFAALSVARMLDVQFIYTMRSVAGEPELYPYRYQLPKVLVSKVGGKRVVVVNDVISAGSAVRGTVMELETHGAKVVAIGALLILGQWTRSFAAEKGIAVKALSESSFELWLPTECPLCEQRVPLQRRIQAT